MTRRHGIHEDNGDGWVPIEGLITRDIFKAEVHGWAKRIGVEVKVLHIWSMTREWGSYLTTGRLTFNAELLRESAEFRKKVIMHELLHLQVPNHGKLVREHLASDETLGLSKRPTLARPYMRTLGFTAEATKKRMQRGKARGLSIEKIVRKARDAPP